MFGTETEKPHSCKDFSPKIREKTGLISMTALGLDLYSIYNKNIKTIIKLSEVSCCILAIENTKFLGDEGT